MKKQYGLFAKYRFEFGESLKSTVSTILFPTPELAEMFLETYKEYLMTQEHKLWGKVEKIEKVFVIEFDVQD